MGPPIGLNPGTNCGVSRHSLSQVRQGFEQAEDSTWQAFALSRKEPDFKQCQGAQTNSQKHPQESFVGEMCTPQANLWVPIIGWLLQAQNWACNLRETCGFCGPHSFCLPTYHIYRWQSVCRSCFKSERDRSGPKSLGCSSGCIPLEISNIIRATYVCNTSLCYQGF